MKLNNSEWRKLLEITKLQSLAIPFIPERERAEKLCDELLAEYSDAPRPSDSDRVYRAELRKELNEIINMDFVSLGERYGTYGWQLVLRRYLEATPD